MLPAMDGQSVPISAIPNESAAAPSAANNALAFIDLARLGRTDWWSATKAFLKLIGWQVLVSIVAGVALYFWGDALSLAAKEVAILVVATAGWYVGLRGAVRRSHGRPVMSLIAADQRLKLGRVALGMALWVCVIALVVALTLPFQGLLDAVMMTEGRSHLAWPLPPDVIAVVLLSVALFPFQAAAEELVFRGWMTQTLGQYLRQPWATALVVAVLFALVHGFSLGAWAFPYYVTMSLSLSAITLLDGRLELAIGVHTINNVCAILGNVLTSADPASPSLFLDSSPIPPWALVQAIAQATLLYLGARWLIRRRPSQIAAVALPIA